MARRIGWNTDCANTMAEQGDVLAERYRLIEPLGEGGMGTVWRAEHVELGSQVAVKIIGENVADRESGLARFKREAKAAAALTSTHVVQIFDYGVVDGRPYIAMELLDGQSLAQRLSVRRTIKPTELVRVLSHVSRAIDQAHQAGILHRDLKPDNVFIARGEGDDEELMKVLDFGVAKALNPDVIGQVPSTTRTGALVGSPYYMGPQQIRGQKTIDHRADLWSIGVMAYECLTGRRPFEGESLGDLVMSVCLDPLPVPSEQGCELAGFDTWFAKACAREPDERFQSAREMYKALQALVTGGVVDDDSVDILEPAAASTGAPLAPPVAASAARPPEAVPLGPAASAAVSRSTWAKVVIAVAVIAAVTAIVVALLLRS